ncbi:hypothetical protein ACFUK0_33125, partial [Kitasatospora sp. NPDC057223]
MPARESVTSEAPIAPAPPGPRKPPGAQRGGPLRGGPLLRGSRLKEHEAALVGGYRELTRLAYLVLPGGTDRHRRILAAHTVVQRALRAADPGTAAEADEDPAYDGRAYEAVRLQVLRGALAPPGRRLLPLPRIRGLRLFTAAGSPEDLALDQALAKAPPHTRAGYALRVLEGLPTERAAVLLAGAGVPDTGAALADAEQIHAAHRAAGRDLDRSPEFDPCAVRVQPTDLLRRRAGGRLLAGGVAAVLAAGAGLP